MFHEGKGQSHRHLLYNLKKDIGETTNLAEENPELVAQMSLAIDRFLKKTKAVTPRKNPKFDPKVYRPERIGVPKKRPAQRIKPELR